MGDNSVPRALRPEHEEKSFLERGGTAKYMVYWTGIMVRKTRFSCFRCLRRDAIDDAIQEIR